MPLRPSERTELRRSTFKVAVDADEGRRPRVEDLVEIGKSRREESLFKKRREGLQNQQAAFNINDKLENLPGLMAAVYSDDNSLQLEGTTQFRKLLSIERSPPIEEVIAAGVVPRLVDFLAREDSPELQFEAAWALTSIASGTSDNTRVVVEHGAIPIFVTLLSSPSEDVREQAVLALGNVAGDSPQLRDVVLKNNALPPLLLQLNEHAKLSMLRLNQHCQYLRDWYMLMMRRHPSHLVVIPALRTIGNIVNGDDRQTQFVIENGALPCLSILLNNHKKSIKKEACWTISNITAGNRVQIQAVMNAGIICSLVGLLHTAEFDITKEAAWAISNCISGGTAVQIKYMVFQGCIKPLCDLLVCPDPRTVIVCLEGLVNILKVGETDKSTTGVNEFAQMIDDAEGLEKIVNLQSHEKSEIYEKAVKILEAYWPEEEEEDANGTQATDGSAGFQFGGDANQPLH